MSLYDEDIASMMEDAADIGAPPIEIGGTEYACAPAALDEALSPTLEGESLDISASVIIPATSFGTGTVPAVGARAKYDGTLYRVASVQKMVGGREYQFGLAPLRR